MMRFSLSFVIMAAVLATSACRKLDNDYERKVALCGSDIAADERLVRVQTTEHQGFEFGQLLAVSVSDSSSTALSISEHGCVRIPESSRPETIFIKSSDNKMGLALDSRTVTPDTWLFPLTLMPKPEQFAQESLQVGCGPDLTAGATTLIHWRSGGDQTLTRYQTTLRLRAGDHVLWTQPIANSQVAGEQVITLPAKLSQAELMLDVSVTNIFDAAVNNANASVVSCSIRIDSEAPLNLGLKSDALTRYALPVEWSKPIAVTPGSPFSFQFRDASAATVMACLKPRNDDSDDDCKTQDYVKQPFTINAPHSGLWTLSYYFIDEAGNVSPTTTQTLAVVNDRLIQSLRTLSRQISLSILNQDFRKNIAALFDATADFFSLSISVEWDAVTSDLKSAYLALASRFQKLDQINPRGKRISSIAFDSVKQRIYLSYADGRSVDVLGENHEIIATWPDLVQVWRAESSQTLFARLTDNSLAQIDENGGVVRQVADGPIDEVQLSDDGSHFLILKDEIWTVLKTDGKKVGQRAQGIGQGIASLSPSGLFAVIVDEGANRAIFWDVAQSHEKTFAPAESDCRVVRGLVSDDGANVYLGLDNKDVQPPYIVIAEPNTLDPSATLRDKKCGLIAWTPTSDKKQLLTHSVLGQIITPHHISALAFAADRTTLLTGSHASANVTYWKSGEAKGFVKKLRLQNLSTPLEFRTNAKSTLAIYDTGEIIQMIAPDDFSSESAHRVKNQFRLSPGVTGPTYREAWLSPDESLVLMADSYGNLEFYSVENGSFHSIPMASQVPMTAFAATKQGRFLFYVDDGKTIRKLDLDDPRNMGSIIFRTTDDAVSALAWTDAGLVFASGAYWFTYDIVTNQVVSRQEIVGFKEFCPTKFLASGANLFVIACDETSLWQMTDQHNWILRQSRAQAYTRGAWNRDGKQALFLKKSLTVEGAGYDLWDQDKQVWKESNLLSSEPFNQDEEFSPFSPDGAEWMMISGGRLLLFDASGTSPRLTIDIQDVSRILKARYLPGTADFLIVGEQNGAQRLWRVNRSGTMVKEFERPIDAGVWSTLITGSSIQDPVLASFENSPKLFAWKIAGGLDFTLGDAEAPFNWLVRAPQLIGGLDAGKGILHLWPLKPLAQYRDELCRRFRLTTFNTANDQESGSYRRACGNLKD